MLPIDSRYHPLVHGKIFQHFSVEMLDHFRRQFRIFARPYEFGNDPVAFPQNIVHFLAQIRLAGRKLQSPLHMLKHLAFRQRISFIRCGRTNTLGQKDFMK